MRRDAWTALADPTRREIIKILSTKPLTINEVAHKFDISRPATSKHIKILRESKLVSIENKGRERFCHLTLEPLLEVFDWVKEYEHFWLNKLDSLEDFMSNNRSKE